MTRQRFLTRARVFLAHLSAPFRRRLSGGVSSGRPYPWEASYPEGLSWHLDIEPRPVYAILDDAVAAFGDKPCLDFLGKKYSYAEVGDLVARAAQGFRDLGVGKGVKVGLFLPNSAYFVICFHAILKAGGTVVNFNPLYVERGIVRQIEDSDARIMVTMNLKTLYSKIEKRLEDTCLEKIVVCGMRSALPFPENALFAILKRKEIADIPDDDRHFTFEKLTANDGNCPPPHIDPHTDIAVLQYTGGTTGVPKGAMLTHGNLYINTVQTRIWASGIRPGEEKILAVLPLFHVFGMTGVMNLGLYIGSELLLVPRFKVGDMLKIIDKERPTVLMGVPTIYSSINNHGDTDKYDLSSLKYCISGGAPLPLEVKADFERITGCTLVEGYGLSEAGPVCTINPLTHDGAPGAAGLPLPGTVIEIVSLKNPNKVLPIGAEGEVCVTGPQVMAGYWKHEAETDAVLSGGRLRTGDIGYMDEDGYVFLIDRIKDLIITGGFNVYPRMVEEAIYLHPAVEEAVVCGVPHPHRGEIIKAYIKRRDGYELTAAELKTFLKDKLAPFEIPRRVDFRGHIPKTLIGKPLRRELIAEELRMLDRQEAQTLEKLPEARESGGPATPAASREGNNAA